MSAFVRRVLAIRQDCAYCGELCSYGDWLAGRSRTTGKPIKISRLVALACAALAAGLEEWARPELPDQ